MQLLFSFDHACLVGVCNVVSLANTTSILDTFALLICKSIYQVINDCRKRYFIPLQLDEEGPIMHM